MSRQIKINKYEGNTHYSVHVVDSFGQEHHLGYFPKLTEVSQKIIEEESEKIWSNEVKRVITPMERAIKWCVDLDITKGREPSLD
tara:strand:+ start:69 stop:323 length:255 start_codon:yes stop_codon:yes gene_type:complete